MSEISPELAKKIGELLGEALVRAAGLADERRPRRKAAKTARARRLRVGQRVSYRQGRATFEAKVVGVDAARGQVELQRMTDDKRVRRPLSKVYPSTSRTRK